MMRLQFTSEARQDLLESSDFYESKEKDLGKRFRGEIASTLGAVIKSPCLWRERSGGYRRVNCPVFPYYISYVIREGRIVVIAIAHGSRKPGFWSDRLQ